MSLFVSGDKEFMRQNLAQVVQRRLSDLGMSLAELSKKTDLAEAALRGKAGITLPELQCVVDVLWPGKEPSEVDELWPSDSTRRISTGRLIVAAAELGVSLPQMLRGDTPV